MQRPSLYFPTDWWDGPRAGLAHYQGETYWFSLVDPDGPSFALFRLSAKEIQIEEERHKLFEEKVGRHFCFHLPYEERVTASSQDWSFYTDPRPDRSIYTDLTRRTITFTNWANQDMRRFYPD